MHYFLASGLLHSQPVLLLSQLALESRPLQSVADQFRAYLRRRHQSLEVVQVSQLTRLVDPVAILTESAVVVKSQCFTGCAVRLQQEQQRNDGCARTAFPVVAMHCHDVLVIF